MEPVCESRLLEILRTTRALLDYYEAREETPAQAIDELKKCMQRAIDELACIAKVKRPPEREGLSTSNEDSKSPAASG